MLDDAPAAASSPDLQLTEKVGLLTKIYRLLRFFEPLGVFLAVAALLLDIWARDEARTVAAWGLLTTEASGNSGKIKALEFLNGPAWFGLFGGPREPLRGIDLQPPPDAKAKTYLVGVNLEGADLRDATLDRVDLSDASFNRAILQGTSFRAASGSGTKFVDADMFDTDFSLALLTDAHFQTTGITSVIIEDARFINGRIVGSAWLYSGSRAILLGTEISGSTLQPRESVLPAADALDTALRRMQSASERPNQFLKSLLAEQEARPSQPPLGFVWALKSRPAEAIPEGLIYFECVARTGQQLHISYTPADMSLLDMQDLRSAGTYNRRARNSGKLLLQLSEVTYQGLQAGDYTVESLNDNCRKVATSSRR